MWDSLVKTGLRVILERPVRGALLQQEVSSEASGFQEMAVLVATVVTVAVAVAVAPVVVLKPAVVMETISAAAAVAVALVVAVVLQAMAPRVVEALSGFSSTSRVLQEVSQ